MDNVFLHFCNRIAASALCCVNLASMLIEMNVASQRHSRLWRLLASTIFFQRIQQWCQQALAVSKALPTYPDCATLWLWSILQRIRYVEWGLRVRITSWYVNQWIRQISCLNINAELLPLSFQTITLWTRAVAENACEFADSLAKHTRNQNESNDN